MTTWTNLLAIAAGGAIGSVARYLVTVGAAALPGGSSILGTTLANVIGCAIIGGFAEYTLIEGMVGERTRLAIQVGFLGGLTTFSTFAAESAGLALVGRWSLSGLYVFSNLLVGWAALLAAAAWVRGWLA